MADSLLARYRDDTVTATIGRAVGVGHLGNANLGDDIAEVLALLGVRPVWDDARDGW